MVEDQIIQWLFENGGAIIKYRTARELMSENSSYDINHLIQNVITNEHVALLFKYLEFLAPIEEVDFKCLNLLHGSYEFCLENIIPRLFEAGIKKGNKCLDKKIQIYRPFLKRVRNSLNKIPINNVKDSRTLFIATLLCSYCVRGGYFFLEVQDLILFRLKYIYKLTKEKSLKIYMNEQEKATIAKKWRDKSVVKDNYEPFMGKTPLPSIHDIYAFIHFLDYNQNDDIKKRILEIINFIFTPQFRQLPWGYGYQYDRQKRQAYGIGWSPNFPDWQTCPQYEKKILIQRLELLSHVENIQDNPWFQDCLNHCEQYKRKNGHYLFPKEYIAKGKTGYYIGGSYMDLENTRRSEKSLELNSTFRMMLIRKNLKKNNCNF